MEQDKIQLFEEQPIRTAWDEDSEEWYFAIVDVIAVLTESRDPQTYWRVMKNRMKKEGNQTVTNCNALKMLSKDGKRRNTDVANTEQLLRLIQSIPSKKAEPFKIWLAQGGRIAGNARKEIEEETGRPVITSKNAKQLNGVVTELIEGVSDLESD